MKNCKDYILEALKINSKSKVNTIRRLSNKDLPNEFFDNFTAHGGDLSNIYDDIFYRKYTPEEFIKNLKYKEQLFCYFYECITLGWEEGYDAFRQEIIDRKYASEDNIDRAAIEIYKLNSRDNTIVKNCEKYFKKYNIEVKDK